MATIGLKVAQDPYTSDSLSLADTLAKGIFGDPEGQMKARALASEVGVRMASRDKLLADTGLVGVKTRQEQDILDAERAAAPLVGNAGAAAVPAIVDPNDVHGREVHDALVAREHALGRLLVHGNPNEVAEGINKNYGGTILSAAAANPAIVSGDALRIAGGLSTGTAPSTSTVWSAGDTSGVDAAARQKILEERGAPDKPVYFDLNNHRYRQNPDGSATEVTGVAAPDPKLVTLPGQGTGVLNTDAQGRAIGVTQLPGAEGRPEKPDAPKTFQGPDGKWYAEVVDPITGKVTAQEIGGVGPAPVKPVEIDPNKTFLPPDPNDPNQVYRRPKTDAPTVIAGPYDDLNSPEGRNNKIIRDAMTLASQPVDPLRPSAITPQIARDYDQAFIEKFGAKTTVQKLPNTDPAKGPLGAQVDTPVTIYPSIPNFLSPTEMYKRAGVSAPPAQTPGPPPQGAAPPAPNPTSNATVVGEPTGPVQAPAPTDGQSKDRRFSGAAAFANKSLDKFTPGQIPGVVASMLAIPKISGTGFLASLARANLPDKDKEWARNALEFTAAVNYEQSGAAVNADEWENAKQIFIPLPNDKPAQLADKAAARRNWMENAAKSGWSNDPKGLQDFMTSLDQPDSGRGGGGGGGVAPSKAPQAMKDAWSHMSADAKARAVQRYGQ